MLPSETKVEGVEILSVSKPRATQPHVCAWCSTVIPKDKLHVRAVWKDRRQDKSNPVVNSDRICIDCWTA